MLSNRSGGRLTRSQTRRNISNETLEDSVSDNTTNDMGAVQSGASGPRTDPEQNEDTQRDAENATDGPGTSVSPSSAAEPPAIDPDPPREEEVLVVQRSDESDDESDVEFLMQTESDDSSGSHRMRRGILPRSVTSPLSSSNLPSGSSQSSPTMSRVAQSLSRIRHIIEVDLENYRNEENDIEIVRVGRVTPIPIQLDDSDSENEVEVV